MKISVVFLCASTDSYEFIGREKLSLLPIDSRRLRPYTDRKTEFQVRAIHLGEGIASPQQIITDIAAAKKYPDAIIALFEAGSGFDVDLFRGSLFSAEFSFPRMDGRSSIRNSLARTASKVLRNFSVLLSAIGDMKYYKVCLLPLKNFDAPELRELRDLCEKKGDSNQFSTQFFTIMRLIRGRETPKTRGSFPHKYLVDDQGKHFQLGHEEHGLPEKGCEHDLLCEVSGIYRFGKAHRERRHYNVSLAGALISGRFETCHHTTVHVRACTHVNMFSNGCIR